MLVLAVDWGNVGKWAGDTLEAAAPALLVMLGAFLSLFATMWVNRYELQREHRVRLYTELLGELDERSRRLGRMTRSDAVSRSLVVDEIEPLVDVGRRLYSSAVLAGVDYEAKAEETVIPKAIQLGVALQSSVEGRPPGEERYEVVAASADELKEAVFQLTVWVKEKVSATATRRGRPRRNRNNRMTATSDASAAAPE